MPSSWQEAAAQQTADDKRKAAMLTAPDLSKLTQQQRDQYKSLAEFPATQAKLLSQWTTKLPSLAELNKVAPAPPVVDAVTAAAPMPKPGVQTAITPAPVAPPEAPAIAKLPDATVAPADIPPSPSAEVTPVEQVAPKPTIDWNKVGEIAKSTGKGILGVLQAAVAGRTAGLAGRAFNPATDTMVGIEKGKAQDLANQTALADKQFSTAQKLKELDQAFTAKQNQIAQDFEAKQRQAEQLFQTTRDTTAYQRDLAAAQAERDQRMKELKFGAEQQVALEKLKQGIGTGTNLTAGDPSNLRTFDPKAAKK